MSTPPADHLPCGAELSRIVDQVGEAEDFPDDDHQRGCVHCRAAYDEVAALWAPVHELTRERVTAPPGLVEGAMDRVRQIAANTWHAVLTGDPGVTRVAARVVAIIARRAAQAVPGVSVALGSSTSPGASRRVDSATHRHHATDSAVGVAGSSAAVQLAIAAEYGRSIPAMADAVRRNVIRELSEQAGIRNVTVDIVVDDVVRRLD